MEMYDINNISQSFKVRSREAYIQAATQGMITQNYFPGDMNIMGSYLFENAPWAQNHNTTQTAYDNKESVVGPN
jgi:hypothetical protein